MQFLVVLAVLMVVILIVSAPLRRTRPQAAPRIDIGDLEAAREAKYREIRDAELDRHTGKLSESDYEQVDGTLRAEALEILHALDRARGTNGSNIQSR